LCGAGRIVGFSAPYAAGETRQLYLARAEKERSTLCQITDVCLRALKSRP